MADREKVSISGNTVEDDTDTFEIETDGEESKAPDETVAVNSPDASENANALKGTFLTGGAIVVGILIGMLVMYGMKGKRRGQAQRKRYDALESRNQQSNRNRLAEMASGEPERRASLSTGEIQVGKVHNIGKRSAQQDSLGVTDIPEGVFAVVADGMGGLSDGDKVSQTIVMTMLRKISEQQGSDQRVRLFEMVSFANNMVNQMLGSQSQYVSGSTVVAVLAGKGCFEWISVGDSRICLYRGGRLIQLNREHNYESELLWQAVNGEISFAEAQENPNRRNLTSFIGMGKLKYVDGSLRPIETAAGDYLLLMSDGIFNTLSDDDICAMLRDYPEPQQAAGMMEQRILACNGTKQDNFTAVILKF